MYCFNCNQTMQMINRYGVIFEHCYGCGAYWFDRGELETVLSGAGIALDEKTLGGRPSLPQSCRWCDQRFGPEVVDCPDCDRPLGYRCPRDQEPMGIINAFGVELDICTRCGGLWFDGRELKALMEGARIASATSWTAEELSPSAEDDDAERPCQVCGAVVPGTGLVFEAGLWRCGSCRLVEHDDDAERAARVKEEYYRRWRGIHASERLQEEVIESQNDPFHRHHWLGPNPGLLGALGRWLWK